MMKAYGVARALGRESPSLQDIKIFCMKSCTGRIKKDNGEYRSSFKNAQQKANGRRYWKRKARAENEQLIITELEDLEG